MRLILLNKPYGVLCQFTDTAGRPTLARYRLRNPADMAPALNRLQEELS